MVQMMEMFHDPVTRRQHVHVQALDDLEVNGCFDPLTRAPLTKSQLHPNRALKQLIKTPQRNRRLGRKDISESARGAAIIVEL
ncbi:U-box domain [Phytophthora infestans]|uniref:U-box domain n=1 Tax=Phytophthora infestans TaxID=4787 RepID=A0A8S9UHC0_PHYIN|nr:U-box domain [Phytophthora infestans]